MIRETESKKEWPSEELQRRERLRKESMVLPRRRTLKIPEEWTEIFSDATISKSSIYIAGPKEDRQSGWFYASTDTTQPLRKRGTHRKDIYAIYQEMTTELKARFRSKMGSSEHKSTLEKDSEEKDSVENDAQEKDPEEKAKHVTYGPVEVIQ